MIDEKLFLDELIEAENFMRMIRRQQLSHLYLLIPDRPWIIEPAQITTDLFDPVFRPWFVSTESKPKDVVFLVDL